MADLQSKNEMQSKIEMLEKARYICCFCQRDCHDLTGLRHHICPKHPL